MSPAEQLAAELARWHEEAEQFGARERRQVERDRLAEAHRIADAFAHRARVRAAS